MTTAFRLCFATCVLLAGTACSSDSGSPAQRFGVVLLESNSTPEPSQSAEGAFYRITSKSSGACFVSEELGSCRVWQCDSYAGGNELETSGLSAGSLTITGTKAPLSLQEGEAGSYSWDNTLNAALWSGGEHLLAKVSGSAEFPATMVTVLAPEPVTAKAPAVPAEAWAIDASKDLGFAWSGASEEDVYAAISVSVPNAEGDTRTLYPGIDCAFRGDLGVAAIPSATLQKLAKPENSEGYLVELLTFAAEAVRVDDAILELRATSFALSALAQIE